MDEMFRAASETSTCVSNAPYDSDSVNSPFKAKFGMPVWQYYQQYPLKAVRFAHAMAGVSQRECLVARRCCYCFAIHTLTTPFHTGSGSSDL